LEFERQSPSLPDLFTGRANSEEMPSQVQLKLGLRRRLWPDRLIMRQFDVSNKIHMIYIFFGVRRQREDQAHMFGSSVSRWTMLHFGAALACFLLAQIAMVSGIAFPAVSLYAPTTLATVHLLTIGWLTVLMLGALHQFVPVMTAQGTTAGASALLSLIAILVGLGGMETGFLTLGGYLPPAALVALPLGGLVVLSGAAIAAATLSQTLWRTRPLPFSAWFVAAGLVFLFVTLGMGITLGLAFFAPDWVRWPGAFTSGLGLHLLAGLIGWFTLIAMGVSYRLLSMFTLAPEDRGALGIVVFVLSAGGLAATWLFNLAAALGAVVPEAVAASAAATGLGLALYLFDVARLYRARRRRKLELNTLMAVPALAALAVATLFAAALGIDGSTESTAGALGYLFLCGWLSGLGLSQLYKIVPFLTWLERYGSLLGKQAVPRVQDLVNERRDRPWYILYFVSVAAGTILAALAWPALWRVAVAGQLAATLMIVRALWLVRHGTPVGRISRGSVECPRSSLSSALTTMENKTMAAPSLLTLDVRDILKAGGEPFTKIMQTVDALLPGQGLRLLATFKPVPLFGVMAQRGFDHTEREIGGGDWEVTFMPSLQKANAAAGAEVQR
jgi:hypothetical protein